VYALPHTDEELSKLLVPDESPGFYRMVPADGTKVQAKFRPFYSLGEGYPYRMYFDRDRLPFVLWG